MLRTKYNDHQMLRKTNKIKLYHVYISKFYGKNTSKRSLEVSTFALKLMIA